MCQADVPRVLLHLFLRWVDRVCCHVTRNAHVLANKCSLYCRTRLFHDLSSESVLYHTCLPRSLHICLHASHYVDVQALQRYPTANIPTPMSQSHPSSLPRGSSIRLAFFSPSRFRVSHALPSCPKRTFHATGQTDREKPILVPAYNVRHPFLFLFSPPCRHALSPEKFSISAASIKGGRAPFVHPSQGFQQTGERMKSPGSGRGGLCRAREWVRAGILTRSRPPPACRCPVRPDRTNEGKKEIQSCPQIPRNGNNRGKRVELEKEKKTMQRGFGDSMPTL